MEESLTTYFEDLNVGCNCPHENAFVPDGEKVYFRKLKGNNAIEDSFIAPPFNETLIDRADACIQKSLSVFDDLDMLINAVFKIQSGKKKSKKIAVLKLSDKDGLLKQTFGKNHHSWWRSQGFNVAAITIQEIEI
ncbi:hypothetical protein [Flavobacterium sp. PL02]|uniref:hypothetical protein n=1 Tax=Flavobacterium sp. PL02 TaxID=3088354 RepID=UPI002B236A24|nr:hypothetical protein [Flavobacterium sp. PL02]MEA9413466.1 hypothetical protein [Flavobacterium sp. PL02]